jgi:cytidyltransferase-like protein
MTDTLVEGGNVFKDAEKNPLTQRINRADVDPTIKWLEGILGFSLIDNKLGTTGKKPTSGDLDLAVDESKHSKDEVYAKLKAWAKENHPEDRLRTWVAKSGISVHLRTPINGDDSQGFVQTDLMFGDPKYMAWSSQGEPGDQYRGQHRMILLNSIASAKGYKWSGFGGLTSRATGDKTTDIGEITTILLGGDGSPDDLTTIPKILAAIKDDPNYDELVAMAVETFPRFGVEFPQKPGMVTEARKGDPRIQHAEDVVFWEGSQGALRVLDLLRSLGTSEGRQATTIKWDGSPAVIFGRDQNGDFILTDKSGFYAKGYDGKAKSPEELKSMFLDTRMRAKGKEPSAGYVDFANNMASAFPIYEKAVPQDHRGFFFGDLLYYKTPPVENGRFKFKPNIVTYLIDVDSEFGERIAKSTSGVVVHLEVDLEGNKVPLQSTDIFQGEDLYVLPPISTQELEVDIDTSALDRVENIVKKNSQAIDELLDSDTLRSRKISNFANLLYSYLNSKVDTGLTSLGNDFLDWADSKNFSDSKKKNLRSYVEENKAAFEALWQVVDLTMKVKDDIIRQLEAQEAPVQAFIGDVEGGEGYVTASPGGSVKLVDRSAFTKANRAVVREAIVRRVREILSERTNLPNSIIKSVMKYFFDVGDKMDLLREVSDTDPTLIKEVSILTSSKTSILNEVMDEIEQQADNFADSADGFTLKRRVAIVPGAFKPPHKGHLAMVEHYADLVDQVYVFISPLTRGAPNKEEAVVGFGDSREIWNVYLENAGLQNKVTVLDSPSQFNSPVQMAYEFSENKKDDTDLAQVGDEIFFGASVKEDKYGKPDWVRFKSASKYVRPGAKAADVELYASPSYFEGLSATNFRQSLFKKDFSKIKTFLPDGVEPEEILNILNIKIDKETSSEESISEIIMRLVRESLDEMSSMAGGNVAFSPGKVDEEEVLEEEEEDEVIEEVLNYLLGKGVLS